MEGWGGAVCNRSCNGLWAYGLVGVRGPVGTVGGDRRRVVSSWVGRVMEGSRLRSVMLGQRIRGQGRFSGSILSSGSVPLIIAGMSMGLEYDCRA